MREQSEASKSNKIFSINTGVQRELWYKSAISQHRDNAARLFLAQPMVNDMTYLSIEFMITVNIAKHGLTVSVACVIRNDHLSL